MNIEEFLEKIEDATGITCEAEVDLDGQLILLTGLTTDNDEELVLLEDT